MNISSFNPKTLVEKFRNYRAGKKALEVVDKATMQIPLKHFISEASKKLPVTDYTPVDLFTRIPRKGSMEEALEKAIYQGKNVKK